MAQLVAKVGMGGLVGRRSYSLTPVVPGALEAMGVTQRVLLLLALAAMAVTEVQGSGAERKHPEVALMAQQALQAA